MKTRINIRIIQQIVTFYYFESGSSKRMQQKQCGIQNLSDGRVLFLIKAKCASILLRIRMTIQIVFQIYINYSKHRYSSKIHNKSQSRFNLSIFQHHQQFSIQYLF